MKKSKLSLVVLLACLSLASCAPVIVGRTPEPAAPGQWTLSMNAGYPGLDLSENDPLNGQTQTPTGQPLNLLLARGVGGNTEVNGTLSLSLGPSLRVGGKTLLVGGMVPIAVDYGVLLPFNISLDAGLLLSYPRPGVEPYGVLRGFVNHVSDPSRLLVASTMTVGAGIPTGAGSFFVEVTAPMTTFYGAENFDPPLLLVGFSIVPTLAYRF